VISLIFVLSVIVVFTVVAFVFVPLTGVVTVLFTRGIAISVILGPYLGFITLAVIGPAGHDRAQIFLRLFAVVHDSL
jgi:hypothetical protein